MSPGVIAAIAYGFLAAVGGLIGYAQAKSSVSLISGLLSGALLILGGWLWSQGSGWGAALALGVAVVLVLVFIRRWWQTRKAMPALLMVGAGVIAIIAMAATLGA